MPRRMNELMMRGNKREWGRNNTNNMKRERASEDSLLIRIHPLSGLSHWQLIAFIGGGNIYIIKGRIPPGLVLRKSI